VTGDRHRNFLPRHLTEQLEVGPFKKKSINGREKEHPGHQSQRGEKEQGGDLDQRRIPELTRDPSSMILLRRKNQVQAAGKFVFWEVIQKNHFWLKLQEWIAILLKYSRRFQGLRKLHEREKKGKQKNKLRKQL